MKNGVSEGTLQYKLSRDELVDFDAQEAFEYGKLNYLQSALAAKLF